jgi:hypothetical protein
MTRTSTRGHVFLVEPDTGQPSAVPRVTLREIGIKERHDLQPIVAQLPEILQEELFVISEEFDQFENANRRLDLLCLDRDARLVIVELKLDATRGGADLQALRYAAFCSGMTGDQVISAYCRYRQCSREQASSAIAAFLTPGQRYPTGQPRIIVAAGEFQGEDLTATALWLRQFSLDIVVIELASYRFADGRILIAPRTLIPLPEAREFQVRIEQRAANENAVGTAAKSRRNRILDDAARRFNETDTRVSFKHPGQSHFRQGKTPIPSVHYEFIWRSSDGVLAVGIHFEARRLDLNARRLAAVVNALPDTERSTRDGRWGANEIWTRYERLIPLDEADLAAASAVEMKLLVDATWMAVCALSK